MNNMNTYNKSNFQLNGQLTNEKLLKFLQNFLILRPNIIKKEEYYYTNINENDDISTILSKNTVPKRIVNTLTGYIYNKPIKYSSMNTQMLEDINSFMDNNEEDYLNKKHLENMLIKGVSYELIFVDEENQIRFAEIEPENAFIIYNNNIIAKPLYGIRLVTELNEMVGIEVYGYDNTVKTYEYTESKELKLINEGYHIFNSCPLIVFENNSRHECEFLDVLTESQKAEIIINSIYQNTEQNNKAKVLMSGIDESVGTYENMENENSLDNILEGKTQAEKNMIIKMEDGYNIDFLQRPINFIENIGLYDKLQERINNSCNLFDITNYKGDLSGKALEYRYKPTDNLAENKIINIKRGLVQRINLFFYYCNSYNNKKYDYKDLTIVFNKQSFENKSECATTCKTLMEAGFPMEVVVAAYPFLENSSEVMDLINKNKEEEKEEFNNLYNKSEE